MRGRIAWVACAIVSGAVASILFLGTKTPLGQVVRAETPDLKGRVADDPDAWRDDLWKIADDLRESSERRERAFEEYLDCKIAEMKANAAYQEAKFGEETAAPAPQLFIDGVAPQRREELKNAVAGAESALRLAEAQLEEADDKAKRSPDSKIAAAEREWYRYYAANAKYTLDKAKVAVDIFEKFEMKKNIASLKAAEQKAKTTTLEARQESSRAEERTKSAQQQIKRLNKVGAEEAKANAALTKALDLESKWRAGRDAKQPPANLAELEGDAKVAAVQARTLWRDAKLNIARDLRSKQD